MSRWKLHPTLQCSNSEEHSPQKLPAHSLMGMDPRSGRQVCWSTLALVTAALRSLKNSV